MRSLSRPLVAAFALIAASTTLADGARTRDSLLATLPKFDPAKSNAARDAAANKVAPPTPEDGVVVLPEFKVLEKKVAQPEPDQWLSSGEVTRREMRRAEAEMNALELALNRWHIPLLMPSFAERARANYESKKRAEEMDRLTRLQNLPGGN